MHLIANAFVPRGARERPFDQNCQYKNSLGPAMETMAIAAMPDTAMAQGSEVFHSRTRLMPGMAGRAFTPRAGS